MGFEDRNGKSYYYRKQRLGNRVLSEYIGTGFLAEIEAARQEADNIDLLRNREIERDERSRYDSNDEKLIEISDFNRNLVTALFLINGFRMHKGEWRKISSEQSIQND